MHAVLMHKEAEYSHFLCISIGQRAIGPTVHTGCGCFSLACIEPEWETVKAALLHVPRTVAEAVAQKHPLH